MSANIVTVDEESLRKDIKNLVRKTVEETLNTLLDEEASELVGAGRYERTAGREAYRSGHYARKLVTGAGEVELNVPKLRGATFQMLASIYFSPFSPTYFRQSRQRGCAGFANADAPLSASRLPPPSRPRRRWIRPSGGTTVPLS